jgi:hypothetical protein
MLAPVGVSCGEIVPTIILLHHYTDVETAHRRPEAGLKQAGFKAGNGPPGEEVKLGLVNPKGRRPFFARPTSSRPHTLR